MPSKRPHSQALNRRRLVLLIGLLALCYPILRFLGFKVPRQTRLVEIKSALGPRGYFLGPDFILFEDEQGPWAVSRTCTHLGCKINHREKEGFLECPCHQSRFSIQGEVIQGPAKRPLPRFKVEKIGDADGYIVTI
ncbi:MAG: ubiquinol-cytochrome c reductase iron-sulfur subunit [Desulfoarculaceae bacterium]|nr:ubiquinol-cytochrome c reductase iron-sulfur subunit [Desulfoarculaceae bacterium]